MALAGERYPVQALGNFGWDGSEWIKIVASAGGLAVNVRSWGFPEVILTGRNITTDIQSLADPTVIGVLRSMGDAGAGAANTTGNTILQWFAEILRAIDDTGVGPTAALGNKTVRRLLEDILAASGGGINEHYESITTVCGAAYAAGGLSQAVENLQVIAENADLEIQTQDLSAVWNATAIIVKKNSFSVIPVACQDYRVRNRGGVALPVATAIVTGYFN
jgi:hypothetical protein